MGRPSGPGACGWAARPALALAGGPPTGRAGGALGAVAQPLYEATLGAAATSLLLAAALRDFRLGHAWPAIGWLALLALTSQVVGWLLITVSMPRLPAALISAMLLVQPAGAVGLGAVILGERPSAVQLLGVALIMLGVVIAARGGARRASGPTPAAPPRDRPGPQHSRAPPASPAPGRPQCPGCTERPGRRHRHRGQAHSRPAGPRYGHAAFLIAGAKRGVIEAVARTVRAPLFTPKWSADAEFNPNWCWSLFSRADFKPCSYGLPAGLTLSVEMQLRNTPPKMSLTTKITRRSASAVGRT